MQNAPKLYTGKSTNKFRPYAGLIGTDKGGKGTTWRHTLYGLAQLGYDVAGVTFPSYNTIGGFGAEVFLSYKELFKYAEELGADTTNWSKEKFVQYYSYLVDRSRSINLINQHLESNGVLITKRTSKGTHGAYQSEFNNIPEDIVFQTEAFFPDPSIIMNFGQREQTLDTFAAKGNAVLDDYESRDQTGVAGRQRKYTINPETVNAQYGFFFEGESPERLDKILYTLTNLFEKHGVKRENSPQAIQLIGREEPKYDLRTKEGIEYFANNFNGLDLLEMFFGQDIKIVKTYEEIMRQDNGNIDPYALRVQGEIEEVIKQYMK